MQGASAFVMPVVPLYLPVKSLGRTYKVQWMQVLGKADAAGRHDQGKLGSFRIYIYVYIHTYIYIYMTSPRDIPSDPHLLRPGFQGNGGRATQLPTC